MTDWKHKLLAYLHDPPAKALDLRRHEEIAGTHIRQAGISDEELARFSKAADWAASAADRLPFPASIASGLRCSFDGVRNTFVHPMGPRPGDAALRLRLDQPFATGSLAEEGQMVVQPDLQEFGNLADDSDDPRGTRWRARFMAHWRLWPGHAAKKDRRFAFLPADTRIPDHTIWTHLQVVSALAGCSSPNSPYSPPEAAFLRVQIGPVQDFIAAARSTRDLWSGSYLLSWLMAAGLKALSAEIGPDAVIFPNLRGQPLFDLHWRRDLWDQVGIGDGTVWGSLGWQPRDYLTASLPNVLLAVVPRARAEGLGVLVSAAITHEWERIAAAVWSSCEAAGLTADEPAINAAGRKERFDAQIRRFPSVSWATTPWPKTPREALELAKRFAPEMPITTSRERVATLEKMAASSMRKEDRDGRFYEGGTGGPKDRLSNPALAWPVLVALNAWALDAIRQTRAFQAAAEGGWANGTSCQKDALTGREEAVAGGREWCRRAALPGGHWPALFKKDDWVGAITLVKRVWHTAYLPEQGVPADSREIFPMPNTRGIAAHKPEVDCGEDEIGDAVPDYERHFAVLALDGDEMGKWASGEKTPAYATQLADYHGPGGERQGAKVYFEAPEFKGSPEFDGFLQQQRTLTPSYHLQFSEALNNFALHCARPVVEAFAGRLIYSGGDDVLALLPADTALNCAQALRLAFQGSPGLVPFLERTATRATAGFECPSPGFLARLDRADDTGRPIPFLVPGPAADVSAGIAIAHYKAPLQDAVRAARAAEKRAKSKEGGDRSAVAVTLMKRSGEIIEWHCKWDGGGLEAHRELGRAIEGGVVSRRFPHRLVGLLQPYVAGAGDTDTPEPPAGSFAAVVDEVIAAELDHTASRQRRPQAAIEDIERLVEALRRYSQGISGTQGKLSGLIGLCQTAAFAARTAADKNDSGSPA